MGHFKKICMGHFKKGLTGYEDIFAKTFNEYKKSLFVDFKEYEFIEAHAISKKIEPFLYKVNASEIINSKSLDLVQKLDNSINDKEKILKKK
jgi:hypothetical protein